MRHRSVRYGNEPPDHVRPRPGTRVRSRRPALTAELSAAEVAHVARLARLELSEDEIARFAGQLSAVLEHVEAVRRLDTSGVPEMAHSMELVNVVRADEVRPSLDRLEVLAAAPATEDFRFLVPRILSEEP